MRAMISTHRGKHYISFALCSKIWDKDRCPFPFRVMEFPFILLFCPKRYIMHRIDKCSRIITDKIPPYVLVLVWDYTASFDGFSIAHDSSDVGQQYEPPVRTRLGILVYFRTIRNKPNSV